VPTNCNPYHREFGELKQRVCGATQHYKASNMKFFVPLMIFFVLVPSFISWMFALPGIHVPFIAVGIGGIFFLQSRIVNHNLAVDNQVGLVTWTILLSPVGVCYHTPYQGCHSRVSDS
jgi:hypothetical protein